MHFFRTMNQLCEASHLYHRRLSPSTSMALKVLVWKHGRDGTVRRTTPILWNRDEPMSHFIRTCRKMGHEPLYTVTLKRVSHHA